MSKEKFITISEKTLFDLICQAQALIVQGKPIDSILPSDKELDVPPSMNGDRAEPGPYEPVIVDGQYRCDCCGFYFNPDEGEWVNEHFFCHHDKEELELIEREEKKTRTGEIPTFKGERP